MIVGSRASVENSAAIVLNKQQSDGVPALYQRPQGSGLMVVIPGTAPAGLSWPLLLNCPLCGRLS
jgi:hypothetical protein